MQVVRDGVVTGLGANGLGDLAVHEPGECGCLDPYRLRAERGGDARRAGEQIVADEDRDRVGPSGVDRRRAPPHLGLVHHVVVVEGRQMGELHDDRRRDDRGRRTGDELQLRRLDPNQSGRIDHTGQGRDRPSHRIGRAGGRTLRSRAELRAQRHQHGSESLASGFHAVQRRLGDQGVVARNDRAQRRLDLG